MQYREGTVTVTNGDNAVIGVGVDFTGIPAGAMFAIPNQVGTYEVQSVVSATEIHLVTPWAGPTLANTKYWIVADFTPVHGLPLVSFNDVDAARIISTAITKIDGLLGGTSGEGGQLTFWAHDYRVNTPPTPANGTAYIVGPEPTGEWAGKAGRYAIYQNGAWVFGNAKSGQLCYIATTQEYVMFVNGAWVKAATQTPKWDDIKDKPSQYAPSSHNHPASQITGVLALAQIPNIPASKITGVLDPSQIPVMPSDGSGGSINAVVSSGGLADLTAAQQAEIRMGSIVTTTDGFRWLYSGTGSKTTSTSYVQLADVTPEWGVIANKPNIFPTDIANVAGLQAALNSANSGHKNFSGVTLDNPATASNHITFRKDGASQWRIINGTDNNLNIQMWDATNTLQNKMVFYSNGNIALRGAVGFDTRPTFAGGAVPWDSANLPSNNIVRATGNQTITGNLLLKASSAYVGLILDGGESGKEIIWRQNGSNRWLMRASGQVEADGDVGTNFELYYYNNAGTASQRAMYIARNTGVATFDKGLRVGNSDVWHKGELLAPIEDKGLIPAGATNDLDLYTTNGIYYQNTNTNATNGLNYPINLAGMLEVFARGTTVYQRYTAFQHSNGQRIYHREKYGTEWGAWKLLIDSANGGDTFFRKDEIPLFAGQANGSEGGEIRLLKSEGFAWAGNMVMDVQGDRLRFWEEGGAYRGFYLDITKGAAGHSEIVHTGNLDTLSIPRTNVNNDFTGAQIFRGASSLNLVTVLGSGNIGNGYGTGVEFTVSSFEPRIKWEDRSTNARNMLMGYSGGSTGGTFYIRNDSAADNTFTDVAMTLNTATKVMQLGGQNVLTAATGVEKSATNLGRTDNVPLVSGTRNSAWWAGLPNGYNVMTNLSVANGSPQAGYGYFSKMASRDADGGWCGFWQGYHTPELYFGGSNASTDMPTWYRVWNSANFNPDNKFGAVPDVWQTDSTGAPRIYFGGHTVTERLGATYIRGRGVELRNAADAKIFGVADNGQMSMVTNQWHSSSDGRSRFYFTEAGLTYIRGADIVFRNNGNTNIAEMKSDGKFYATGDIYNGVNTWFRVRGSNQGIHWENFSGGWFMNDTSWMRVYNNKGIITTGAVSMGSFSVTSDRRIKTDLKPIQNHGEIIDATNVYEFTKNNGTANENRQYGVIAQEAAKVVPLLVKPSGAKHTDGSDLLGVDLTGYIPILLEEVKALRARVAELEKVAA